MRINDKLEVIRILKDYKGKNPYILALRRDVCLRNNDTSLTDLAVEYVLANKDVEPLQINKTIKIADWYGEKLKEKYELDFTPEKILIKAYLGQTDSCYHCYIKYRQSMEPMLAFLPKKGVLNNFLLGDYNNMEVDFSRYDRLSMAKDPNRVIQEHQKTGVKFLLDRKWCILADDMGLGKLEPISSMIPTPDGYKRMGDIIPGDFVFGWDGKPHKVLQIFPHENKEIYKVTFSDGTSCECGLDHLWTVRDRNMVARKQGWKVLSLRELLAMGLQYHNSEKRIESGRKPINKFEIPVCDAVEYEEKDLYIHPYILGVMIGDGNLCGGGTHISIPDSEMETSERITKLLQEGYKITIQRSSSCPRHSIVKSDDNKDILNKYNTVIKELGLNVHGNDKFIPEIYKLSSIQQRIDLLRGLMDSDGTISKERNKISYSTISKRLAEDVKELVCSLGGIARVHTYDRTSQGKNVEYNVSIQIKINPFYLKRKADRYCPTFKKYCTRHILSAEYVRNEDAQCILVDSDDHTYLTSKNYIVTHNTTTLSVASIEGNFDSILIICPASLKTNWKKELMWYVPERDITIIEGFIGKTKAELEQYLGYGIGKSGKKISELQEEAKERGKWVDNKYVIVNFDILNEFYQIPASRSKIDIETAEKNSPMLQFIKNKKSLIIIDEAHRLSNSTSIQYKIVNGLIKKGKPDSLYLATGTPITNNPQNYYNLLNLINSEVAKDWNYYMTRYCGAIKIPKNGEEKEKRNRITQDFLKIKGLSNWYQLSDDQKLELNEIVDKNCKMMLIYKEATNLEELKEKTSHVYLRRTKDDLKGLPNKRVHEMIYTLPSAKKAEYDRLWEEYENAQLEADPTKELNKELLEGGIYKKFCSMEMIQNTIKLAQGFINNNEKVVIMCAYDDEIYTLRDYYGDKCVVYNGKMSLKEKDVAIKAFWEDKNKMVFLGNYIAAGVGINLTCSHIMIFNSISYVPGDNRQCEDRIHRLGAAHDCDIYYQFFKDTQYEKMWNIVLKKELNIDSVIKKEDEK